MANITKSLKIGNSSYEFVGKHWYGTCPTAAATQTKTVSITGFTSSDLVAGTKVTVSFRNENTYSGQPRLNVSSTGNYYIVRRAYGNTIYEYGGKYEWGVAAVITFTFNGYYWVIDNGEAATTSRYGKTILSNTISDDDLFALTPKAVYDAGYITGINSSDVTTALGYTPYNGTTNPNGYLTLADLPVWDGGVE